MNSESQTRRKRKYDNNVHTVLDELDWTATRCFRLLRSIESRIAILRRIARTAGAAKAHSATKTASVSARARHETKDEDVSSGRCDRTTQHELTWSPEGKGNLQGRLRTYRRGCSERNPRRAASISFTDAQNLGISSPLLKRFRVNVSEHGKNCLDPTKVHQRPNRVSRRFDKCYLKRTTDTDEAERQLEMAFTNVLLTTRATTAVQSRGVRTLKSLCLRQVHSYIELDNEIANADDRDSNNDCTFEIYTSLESWGSGGGVGRRELREVIRAHSTGVVCKAIGEGLVSYSAIERLIEICNEQGGVEEGQKLIHTWLSTTVHPDAQQLGILERFSKTHLRYGFSLRMWSEIASRDHSFLQAQIRKPGLEDVMLKSLMEVPGLEASDFFSDCVLASLNSDKLKISDSRPTTSLHMGKATTRVAIVATLCTILPDKRDDIAPLVEHVLRAVVGIHLYHSNCVDMNAPRVPKYLLMAIAVLMTLQSSPLAGSMTKSMRALLECVQDMSDEALDSKKRNDVDNEEVAFAKTFAGAMLSLEGYLKVDLIGRLINVLSGTKAIEMVGKDFLRRIQLELAIAASQSDYSEQNDPALMEEVSRIMAYRTSEASMKTPDVKIAPRRLRWEESICEWTLMTPVESVAARSSPIIERIEEETSDEEPEGDDTEHTLCNDDEVPMASSPDILMCSPWVRRACSGESDSVVRRTRITNPSHEIYTPTKKGSRKSLTRSPRPSESPDIISMHHRDPAGKGAANVVHTELNLSLLDQRSVSVGHEVKEPAQRTKRRSVAAISTMIDDDEDELG